MFINMLKAKLHQACVTQAQLYYDGSCAIDDGLLEIVGILPHEQVQVYNINNGHRLTTYAISAPKGSGTICANGAAAHLIQPGDRIIICSYAMMEEAEAQNFEPKVAILDKDNVINSSKNIP